MLVSREAFLDTSTIYWLSMRTYQSGMERLDLFNDLVILPDASGGDGGGLWPW